MFTGGVAQPLGHILAHRCPLGLALLAGIEVEEEIVLMTTKGEAIAVGIAQVWRSFAS